MKAAKKDRSFGADDTFEDVMRNVIAIRFDAMNDSDSDLESASGFGGNSSDEWSSD